MEVLEVTPEKLEARKRATRKYAAEQHLRRRAAITESLGLQIALTSFATKISLVELARREPTCLLAP